MDDSPQEMPPLHSASVRQLIEWVGPPADDVLAEMEARADHEGFPTVGLEVGRTLALCTRFTGARSVLELGSEFGYSAYWIARALPGDGSVLLTERDEQLLHDARTYFERGGLIDRAVFEHGDALAVAKEHEGLFDLVFLDHDTADYVQGFDVVRGGLAPDGTILANNVMTHGDTQTPAGLLATLDGKPSPNDRTRVVSVFYEHVLDDPEFETYVLPVGEGLSISRRV